MQVVGMVILFCVYAVFNSCAPHAVVRVVPFRIRGHRRHYHLVSHRRRARAGRHEAQGDGAEPRLSGPHCRPRHRALPIPAPSRPSARVKRNSVVPTTKLLYYMTLAQTNTTTTTPNCSHATTHPHPTAPPIRTLLLKLCLP